MKVASTAPIRNSAKSGRRAQFTTSLVRAMMEVGGLAIGQGRNSSGRAVTGPNSQTDMGVFYPVIATGTKGAVRSKRPMISFSTAAAESRSEGFPSQRERWRSTGNAIYLRRRTNCIEDGHDAVVNLRRDVSGEAGVLAARRD